MATLKVRTRMGDETSLKENTIQEFGQSLRGELIQPGDASYNEARPESCHLCLRVSHCRRNRFNHGHRRSYTWRRHGISGSQLRPYSEEGRYVNFMSGDDQDRVRANYRQNYDRLIQIKTRYDPTDLFQMNQNIKPSL